MSVFIQTHCMKISTNIHIHLFILATGALQTAKGMNIINGLLVHLWCPSRGFDNQLRQQRGEVYTSSPFIVGAAVGHNNNFSHTSHSHPQG